MRECTEGGVFVVAMCFALMTMIQNQKYFGRVVIKRPFIYAPINRGPSQKPLIKLFPIAERKESLSKAKD